VVDLIGVVLDERHFVSNQHTHTPGFDCAAEEEVDVRLTVNVEEQQCANSIQSFRQASSPIGEGYVCGTTAGIQNAGYSAYKGRLAVGIKTECARYCQPDQLFCRFGDR